MAIIFKCFVFARPVSNAFHDLPQLLLQQPLGAGTITPFHSQATKPQPSTLIPPRLKCFPGTVLLRRKCSINDKGLSWSCGFKGQEWKMWLLSHRDNSYEMLLWKVRKSLKERPKPALSDEDTVQATKGSHIYSFKFYVSHVVIFILMLYI